MKTGKSFYTSLSDETRAVIAERGVSRKWPRSLTIFRIREECTGLHIIVDGLVKLYRSNTSGHEQIILLEGAGGVLTISPVLDQGPHLLSAETLKPTETLFLDRSDFLKMYSQHQDFRDAIVLELARRFRSAVSLLETIALKPVIARVATRLIDLASASDALDGSQPFRLLLSQEEMAHVLATRRESVARALADLRASNVIETNGSKVHILDPELLFKYSQLNSEDSATPLPF